MFQANYKDTRMTLTETVLLSFLLWTLDKFLFPGTFSKIILFKRWRIFEDIYSWNYNTNVRVIVPWYITVAMYKIRNTGTGNGMRGTRGMGGMLYSGECRQKNIPGNVLKHSGECRKTFRGMSPNILGNVHKHSGECRQTFEECPQTFRGMSPNRRISFSKQTLLQNIKFFQRCIQNPFKYLRWSVFA